MIVTPAEMRAIEDAAFAAGDGTTPESLMEKVGAEITNPFRIGYPSFVLVYAGKGNNAGDAFVAARRLFDYLAVPGNKPPSRFDPPFRVALRLAVAEPTLGSLAQKKLTELPAAIPRLTAAEADRLLASLPSFHATHAVLLDGLLGLGAHGPLREPIRAAAREINEFHCKYRARVIAIDTPSGVDTDTGKPAEDAVVASETFAVGFAKTGLLADAATNHVGRLSVLSLPELDKAAEELTEASAAGRQRGTLTTRASLAGLLLPRAFDAHKGQFGHVGILAGSVGATGAAVMCSHAAVRAGAGLVTLFVVPEVYPIVAAAAAPEVMVRPLDSPLELLKADAQEKYDVLAVGPGLGRTDDASIRKIIEKWPGPMVVDADGLNALAGGKTTLRALDRAVGPRLLTPHPGEMARLRKAGGHQNDDGLSRLEIAREFTAKRPGVTLLLKGARSLIAQRGRPSAYNTTGNPGMASGGMGDVLTGICAALLGQKLAPFDAARLGAWVHGRAADLAIKNIRNKAPSQESLAATDLFAYLGAAFEETHAL